MRYRWLKYCRVVISLLFLGFAGFLFLDFAGTLSSALVNGITWIQVAPSLLKFLSFPAFLSLGFLVVIVATVLMGRIYCSTVCPLGILQDVISRASRLYTERIRGKAKRYRPAPARNLLRYSLLGVTVLFLIFGSSFFLNLLDPFSLFGKMVSGLVRPLYFGINNIAADWLQSRGIYTLYHVETRQLNALPLIYPALLLGLVAWFAFTRGRLYCNTICPVGSLLGLLSKYSMFRIQIDNSLCTRCNQCSLNCKAQCIDLKNQRVDFTRCVGCFNCFNACSAHGINYRNQWFPRTAVADRKPPDGKIPTGQSTRGDTPQHPDAAPEQLSVSNRFTDSGRRTFLFRLLAYGIGHAAASRVVRAGAMSVPPADHTSHGREPDIRDDLRVVVTQPSTIAEEKQFPVSPPGSMGLDHFNKLCTACRLCVSACPTRVLQPSFLEYGFTGMMRPRMDFHASFCRFDCVRCTEICPTGAILPLTLEQKRVTQIGVVKLELDNCVVRTENTACGACAEHCPTQAVFMVPYQDGLTIPEIDVDHCVGCGACEYICPTRPYRAIYVDGNPRHRQAVPPIIKALDYVPDDDFPF
jgi:ferredoxin